jgi:hypothetical protein
MVTTTHYCAAKETTYLIPREGELQRKRETCSCGKRRLTMTSKRWMTMWTDWQ